jgi:histidyl-tRNA synthetase
MAQTISIPKGTRDFGPEEMNKRNFIFNTIENIFNLYGYSQIETPSMENLSTLMGKYGEEGDKLLFKILNSGDYLTKANESALQEKSSTKLTSSISEKGLRYDLTVPFARWVVQHRNDINFPFKRYQIQPVWRADRPQKGRYREFYQCDADIIGSDSLINEVELIKLIDDIFNKLNINTIIKINNRKILQGISEVFNETDKLIDIAVAIDKLDKIGIEQVAEELKSKNINKELINYFKIVAANEGFTLNEISKLFANKSEIGNKGVKEIKYILSKIEGITLKKAKIEIDFTLARGLNYYTGTIIEVKSADVSIGSICGGGRYDNLTGIFGLNDVSGVGVSFGADRIYDVLEQSNGFPKSLAYSTKVLFVNFGEKELDYCNSIIYNLRDNGISAELYPDFAKMKKQLNYADKKHINFVVLIGETEMLSNTVTLKNMISGEQINLSKNELLLKLKESV